MKIICTAYRADLELLATLIKGNDAIITAFNPGWNDPNLYDDQVRGTTSNIAATKKVGIKRVLWVGGVGGLEVKPGVRVIDSPDLPNWVRPGSLATINAPTNCGSQWLIPYDSVQSTLPPGSENPTG